MVSSNAKPFDLVLGFMLDTQPKVRRKFNKNLLKISIYWAK